ncbi:MAG: phosphonate ABC transporter, permease protein PhnE [Myxococcales bacterium]|nr:phosphonate ABC transporter, permease protein PhnE [Myxococcales bacterium]
MRTAFALALALFVALFAPRPADAQQRTQLEAIPDEIVLGFHPAENAQALQQSADALARALSARIQLPVRAFVTLDSTALVEAMRSGQVHFGWLTPAPLILAEQFFDCRVVLTQVRRGSPSYFSALVVRDDSPIRTPEDLRGRSIAWIEPNSTSGFVIPRYLLAARGLEPERTFRQQVFAGGHDSAVLAVYNGQVDVAAVWAEPPSDGGGAWTRFLRNRPPPRLRPILYSPPIPSDAVGVHPNFLRAHGALVRSVKNALVSMGQSEEGRAILRRLNSTDGFIEATSDQYALVRRAYAQNRAAQRSRGFERPWDVAVFSILCALAAALALPLWSRNKRRARARAILAWTALSAAALWSAIGAQLSLAKLFAGRANMFAFVRGMLPPDRAVVPSVIESAIVTAQLALIGTLLAVPLAVVLAFLAAENTMPSRPVRTIVRFALNLDRSVDTLILALVLVSAVGLGPLPGVLALAIHSVGALAKQFYETLETLDPGPPEAMRAVGMTPTQVLRWGVWPQFAAHFVSIVLFRFELNVRVSTVLGLVGAGGIGFLLMSYMRGAEYAKVTVVVAAIVAMVMALDAISSRLRRDVK